MADATVTEEQILEYHRRASQALYFAETMVKNSAQWQPADIGLPRRDGAPRTRDVFADDGDPREIRHRDGTLETVTMKTVPDNIGGKPRVEFLAGSVAAAGFMLAEELEKLSALPFPVREALIGAHVTAVVFAESVREALHIATEFDRMEKGNLTVDRPRPTTEIEWEQLARKIAPFMLGLQRRLKTIQLPDHATITEAMRVEVRDALRKVRDAKHELEVRIQQEQAQAAQKQTPGKPSHSKKPIPRGNSGAPITTEEQAKFAISRLRSKPKPKWATIVLEWNQTHTDDRVELDNLRGAVRRYEHRQAQKQAAKKPSKRKAAGKKRT